MFSSAVHEIARSWSARRRRKQAPTCSRPHWPLRRERMCYYPLLLLHINCSIFGTCFFTSFLATFCRPGAANMNDHGRLPHSFACRTGSWCVVGRTAMPPARPAQSRVATGLPRLARTDYLSHHPSVGGVVHLALAREMRAVWHQTLLP